jgi:hypothetical protein
MMKRPKAVTIQLIFRGAQPPRLQFGAPPHEPDFAICCHASISEKSGSGV